MHDQPTQPAIQNDRSAARAASPNAGYAPPPQAPATGAFAWWSMFLALMPLPVISALIWLIVAAAAAFSSRHPRGSIARENGRNAFSWACTYVLVFVVSFISIGFFTTFDAEPAAYEGDQNVGPLAGFGVVGAAAILLYVVLAWLHAIRGGTRAGRGEIYAAWGAIPFLRRTPPSARG